MVINKNVQIKKPIERIVRINIVSESREVLDDNDDDDDDIDISSMKNGFKISFELDCSLSNDDVLTKKIKQMFDLEG